VDQNLLERENEGNKAFETPISVYKSIPRELGAGISQAV
jgi:hypothetical protein